MTELTSGIVGHLLGIGAVAVVGLMIVYFSHQARIAPFRKKASAIFYAVWWMLVCLGMGLLTAAFAPPH